MMGERTKRLSKKALGIVASLAIAIGLMLAPAFSFAEQSNGESSEPSPAVTEGGDVQVNGDTPANPSSPVVQRDATEHQESDPQAPPATDVKYHTVTVNGGTANPNPASEGQVVTITADKPADGYVFVQWVSNDVSPEPRDGATATFPMPDHSVEFTTDCHKILIDDIEESYVYTGKPITPKPTVLVDGVDVALWGTWSSTFQYVNNENKGTATVIVTFSGRPGSQSKTFDITPASITGAEVEFPNQIFYGDKPTPKVIWEGITLKEGTDYELSYDENAPIGTSTVTITGIGNFKDEKSADYTITERPVTITVDDASKVVGEADPTFTGAVDGLVKDGDLGEIKYSRTNKDEAAGTYKDALTATYTPNANYTVSVVNGSFTIKQLYTVTWLDGDGSVLQTKTYAEGDKPPAYDGKTPTKAATAKFTYTFTGWDSGTVKGTTTTYKPLFDEKEKGVYEVVSGAGGTWTEGSSEPLVFTFKRTADDETTFDHFVGIEVDGAAVPQQDASGRVNYTAERGSVIVSLQPAYLATLSEGKHTVKALFDDGDGVEAAFAVGATPATHTVTFDANGHGTAPAAQEVEDGKTATRPADPKASGWTFGGWYTDKECTQAYDFSTPVTSDITLYAKWTKASGAGSTARTGDGAGMLVMLLSALAAVSLCMAALGVGRARAQAHSGRQANRR